MQRKIQFSNLHCQEEKLLPGGIQYRSVCLTEQMSPAVTKHNTEAGHTERLGHFVFHQCVCICASVFVVLVNHCFTMIAQRCYM